jgi:hypothetical protein
MKRRQADSIQQKIDHWERLREDLGADATHSVVGYISAELDRLRLEKLMRSRPVRGGRRADDPQPRTAEAIRLVQR